MRTLLREPQPGASAHHSLFQHLLVLLQGFGDIEVGHHIASDKDEVRTNKGLGIHVSQHVPEGAVQVRGDKAHCVGRCVPAPLGFSARRKKNHQEGIKRLFLH